MKNYLINNRLHVDLPDGPYSSSYITSSSIDEDITDIINMNVTRELRTAIVQM